MTPGGKRKEHYLEPLRAAELDRLHAKTAEPTMEQYIEIDDELPELTEVTGTSSPMPTRRQPRLGPRLRQATVARLAGRLGWTRMRAFQ
jgi:hypothetical protein